MTYNRTAFFNAIRSNLTNNGSLSQSQVDGFNNLLNEGETRQIPLGWIAYVLATAWYETAYTMQPVRETLASTDAQAIATLNRLYPNVRNKYWEGGWFGRGYVQLTWQRNYQIMGQWLGVNLVGNPSLALDPTIAAKIAYEGMIRGMFTGRKLSDYISNTTQSDQVEFQDYVNARRIINGTNRDTLIAGFALKIQKALQSAQMALPVSLVGATIPQEARILKDGDPNSVNVAPEPQPIPQPIPPQEMPTSLLQSWTVWGVFGTFLTTVVSTLGSLTLPIQILLLLFSFGFLFWTIFQVMKGNNSINRII